MEKCTAIVNKILFFILSTAFLSRLAKHRFQLYEADPNKGSALYPVLRIAKLCFAQERHGKAFCPCKAKASPYVG